jgi:hypothetical protein
MRFYEFVTHPINREEFTGKMRELSDSIRIKYNVDVRLGEHFLMRANDPRNNPPYTLDEIIQTINDIFSAYGGKEFKYMVRHVKTLIDNGITSLDHQTTSTPNPVAQNPNLDKADTEKAIVAANRELNHGQLSNGVFTEEVVLKHLPLKNNIPAIFQSDGEHAVIILKTIMRSMNFSGSKTDHIFRVR